MRKFISFAIAASLLMPLGKADAVGAFLGYKDKEAFTILGTQERVSVSEASEFSIDEIEMAKEWDIPITEDEIIAKVEEWNKKGYCPAKVESLKTAALCAWNASVRMNEYGFLAAGQGSVYAHMYIMDKYPKFADEYATEKERKDVHWATYHWNMTIDQVYEEFDRRLPIEEVESNITFISKENERTEMERKQFWDNIEKQEQKEEEELNEMKQTDEVSETKDKTIWEGIMDTIYKVTNTF